MWVIAVWAISGGGGVDTDTRFHGSKRRRLRNKAPPFPGVPTVVTTNESVVLSNRENPD